MTQVSPKLSQKCPKLNQDGARWIPRAVWGPSWSILGLFLELQFSVFLGISFLTSSLTHFRQALMQFQGSTFGTRWAQERLTWDPRGPSRASKARKHGLAKTLWFSRVLGSQAIQDSLGRSKKAPKRHLRTRKT